MATPGGYKTVVLKNVGAVDHAVEPWPRVFLVSRWMFHEAQVELRPLTVRSFFLLVLRNWLTAAVWGVRHLCWRIGFIDFDERRMVETNYWGDWRWRWWLPRVGRAPVKETARALTESEVVTLPSAAVPGSAADPDAPLMEGHLKPLGDDLAKTLFGAYNDQGPNPWKTWDGKDVPHWDALSDQVREKWRAVARSAAGKATEALRQLLAEDGFSPTREGWVERVGMWQRRAEIAEAELAKVKGRDVFTQPIRIEAAPGLDPKELTEKLAQLGPQPIIAMPVEDPITTGQRAVLVAADKWYSADDDRFLGELHAAVKALREAPAKVEKP